MSRSIERHLSRCAPMSSSNGSYLRTPYIEHIAGTQTRGAERSTNISGKAKLSLLSQSGKRTQLLLV